MDLELVAPIQERHLDLERDGMRVLLGWSVANLAAAPLGATLSDSVRGDAFWLGNGGWNVVNAAIAGGSLATLPARRRVAWDMDTARRQTDRFERTLILNVGLDVAYLAAAGWLAERGRRTGDERFIGLGNALALQGGFLLVFDSAMLWRSSRVSRALDPAPPRP